MRGRERTTPSRRRRRTHTHQRATHHTPSSTWSPATMYVDLFTIDEEDPVTRIRRLSPTAATTAAGSAPGLPAFAGSPLAPCGSGAGTRVLAACADAGPLPRAAHSPPDAGHHH